MNKTDEIFYKTAVKDTRGIMDENSIKAAMRECAITFAEWIGENNYVFADRDKTWVEISTGEIDEVDYTTPKLYEKFEIETSISKNV